ncbi:MAG: FHA domain-containing protein, partial [Bryobacterales bacterium]|nr:FHA domain-containing protein [Bryobacterales bacterium]
TADIPLADPSVSRQHAEIQLLDTGCLFLIDCNSSNGTWLFREGIPRRIQQDTVSAGEEIQFGSVRIAASDLIDVAQRSLAPPAPQPQARTLPKSTKLVRCGCGAVVALGSECPFCGVNV